MRIIVAMDERGGIGFKNDLLFKLKEDMNFFKETTKGFGKVIIMGMKTFKSLKCPLPGRLNVIMSKSTPEGKYKFAKGDLIKVDEFDMECDVTYVHVVNKVSSLNEFLKTYDTNNTFVIGGAEIYKLLLPYCDYAYITKAYKTYQHVDVKFPVDLFNIRNGFNIVAMSGMRQEKYNTDKIDFRFFELERKGAIKNLPESI